MQTPPPSLGWGNPGPDQFLPLYAHFFESHTKCVSNPPAHVRCDACSQPTRGSQLSEREPQSHHQPRSSPAHPRTGHETTACLCDSRRCTGDAAQAAKHQPRQRLLLQNTNSVRLQFWTRSKPTSPSLQLKPVKKGPSRLLSTVLMVSCTPPSSLLGLVALTGTFLPPSLHWQGHSAAVRWQQLSLPFGGENLNHFLRSHEKAALKESDHGRKATVPHSCASWTSDTALKYHRLAPGRWGLKCRVMPWRGQRG